MTNALFNIREGKYVVPGLGSVNATKAIDNDVALSLYKNLRFPFITPIIDKPLLDFLKAKKLSAKELSGLIIKATSKEEVEMLMGLSKTKAVQSIAESRINGFGGDQGEEKPAAEKAEDSPDTN